MDIKKEILSCTRILNIMTVLGFMTNYMLRVNLSMAIVDMLEESNSTEHYERVNVTRYNWDVIQKNELLGAFFWGYISTDVIGGRLSELLGPRLIFGGGIMLGSWLTLLVPSAADLHYYVVFCLRIGLGLCLGVTYPAIAPLAVKWIPPSDRSKYLAHMLSQGLGIAVTLPVSGYLISVLGWPSVFYATGVVGLLWSGLWFYLIYDSPAKHPRISIEEKTRIETGIKNEQPVDTEVPEKLPWKQLMGSPCVWAIIIAHGAMGYCQFFNMTELPTYENDVYKFEVKTNGILSSTPNLGQYLVAILAGYAGDKLIKSGKLSKSVTRKMFASFSFFIPAVLCAALAVWGYDPILGTIMLITTISCLGFTSAGHISNGLDIAPNFSGTIMGFATMAASACGWVVTKIVGLLTKEDKSFESWKYVFWIMMGVNIVGGSVFVLFSKAEIQDWNHKKKKEESIKI